MGIYFVFMHRGEINKQKNMHKITIGQLQTYTVEIILHNPPEHTATIELYREHFL